MKIENGTETAPPPEFAYKVVDTHRHHQPFGVFMSWSPYRPEVALQYRLDVETKALPNSRGIYCFLTLESALVLDKGCSGKYILKCRYTGKINYQPLYFNGSRLRITPQKDCITVDAVVPVTVAVPVLI